MINGLDIASYQGEPDFAAVAADGVEFVIVKSSEGAIYTNPTLEANWDGIKAANLARGCYHYASPDWNTALSEANYFLSVMRHRLEPGDLIALDLESGDGNLVNWALEWLNVVETATGITPLLYSGRWFMAPHGLYDPRLARHPLWLAEYVNNPVGHWPSPPPYWDKVTLWQWSESGDLASVQGREDHNLFNGSVDDLRALGKKPEDAPMDPTLMAETMLRLDEVDDLARQMEAQLPSDTDQREEIEARTELVRAAIDPKREYH